MHSLRKLITTALLLGAGQAMAQTGGVTIGAAGTPDPSAVLDLRSSAKGLLAPRLTQAQRDAITSPATGLLVYQTDNTPGFYVYSGAAWTAVGGAGTGDNLGNHTATQTLNLQDNAITGTGANITGVGIGVRADGGLNIGQSTGNVFLGHHSGMFNNGLGTGNTFLGINSGLYNKGGSLLSVLGSNSGPCDTCENLENATAVGANVELNADNTVILGHNARVGIGTNTPAASAALDITSTTQGLLAPRMSQAQRNAIATPATGLLVYQTDNTPGFYVYSGSAWTAVGGAGTADNLGNHTATQALNLQGNALTGTGASIGTTVGLGVRADGGLNIGQNTTGKNVYLGYGSGQANTTGDGNTFSGYQSGLNNADGYGNTFTGYGSGQANTSGNSNTFTGYRSGVSNITGTNNTFNGFFSGVNNTMGGGNTFSGSGSGNGNTLGYSNTFAGSVSGYSNKSGNGNVFAGGESGYSNIDGSYNTFSGYRSGNKNSSGGYNAFTGMDSGYSNTTGNYNTFSGSASGGANTTGANNTFSGYGSGQHNTTGSNITALGYNSGPSSSSGNLTNATAVGANTALTQSNTVILGNNASVGIGTSAPSQKLEVVGNIKISGTGNKLTFPDGTSQTTAATAGATGPQGATGATGATGAQGPAGPGVPVGGTAGQVLSKIDGTNYNTQWITPATPAGDNLGNHTATQALNLQGNALTGTGASITGVGLGVRADGGLNIGQNTSGNVYLGFRSGQSNTTGQSNTFSGVNSGLNNTVGSGNTFSGANSGQRNISGTFNTFSGTNSGTNNTAGQSNTFSGVNSGLNNTVGEGNTFSGTNSGIANTTGNNNTAIGSNSGPGVNLGNLNNATAVGANVTLTNSNTVILGSGAFVGIGTSNPGVPLDVQSVNSNYTVVAQYGYLAPGGSGTGGSNTTTNVSIRANGRIVCPEFNAVSDRRLKNVVGLSDRAADLALLQQLRITDYTMRDRVTFGSQRFKKVIAQEVEQVFPQAVHQQVGFLPDVYAPASSLRTEAGQLWLELPAGLTAAATAGQRLKLIGATGAEVLATLAQPAAAGARRVALAPVTGLPTDAKQLFVFGFEHQDVRAVDYEALSMLNVSATQELARQLAELQARHAALQNQASTDHADLQTLKQQLARLLGEAAPADAQAHR